MLRQLREGDPLGLGRAVRSRRTDELRPRTSEAERTVQSVCPFCAVGCAQGRVGDSLINVAPKEEIIERFEQSGGKGKPKYGRVTVCYAESKEQTKKTAFEVWPNALVEGSASQELPPPKDFEQLVEDRSADELDGKLVLGNDPEELSKSGRTMRTWATRTCPPDRGSGWVPEVRKKRTSVPVLTAFTRL